MNHRYWIVALAICASMLAGFYHNQTPGYTLERVADQFTSPVGVAVGERGELYVAESGNNTGTPPRIVSVQPRKVLADDFPAPLTGVTWHDGKLFVSYAGGIDVLDPKTGVHHPILKDLPARGDHANNAVTVNAEEGKLYFGLGTATNAGVVGDDNLSWVKVHPDFHDIPCKPVTLRGSNFSVANLLTPDPLDYAVTGAFVPFGKTTARLQQIPGAVPCTGAILRANLDGSNLELVAWGLRNPYGVAFGPDHQLYATVQGYADRGSRPVVGDHDYFYRILPDRWYGWPDYAGGRSLTEEEFQRDGKALLPLLAGVPEQPPEPVVRLPHGAGASALLFPPEGFGLRGNGLVSLSSLGQIVRVNPRTGEVTPLVRHSQLLYPTGLAAGPHGTVYVTDAGDKPGSGSLWRIRRGPGR